MGKIIKLQPRDPFTSGHGKPDERASDADSIEQATQRLIETVAQLIQTLETSHRRIRVLIDSIPDPEASARLARDHAMLSAALRDAKEKAISIGLAETDDEKS
ncbi:hypothetical protein [Hyphomicrobium sp. CS1GBMeth3]|uniref:hypothetical protein n=1 Tax=Hyphomicrobium sp. CS1GBMeth3 TaxID=1892845 RepID=UPI0009300BDB|nr:hypothetical protein [Hyphomicrobium sp. CS1GBMeth3]